MFQGYSQFTYMQPLYGHLVTKVWVVESSYEKTSAGYIFTWSDLGFDPSSLIELDLTDCFILFAGSRSL